VVTENATTTMTAVQARPAMLTVLLEVAARLSRSLCAWRTATVGPTSGATGEAAAVVVVVLDTAKEKSDPEDASLIATVEMPEGEPHFSCEFYFLNILK
jgi:hypothetical protein